MMSAKRSKTRQELQADAALKEDLSSNTTQVESVAVIAPDQPKTICPGDRSIASAIVAANPGRALEVGGLEAAA